MHITLVEDRQDYVHHKHCEGHQDRQTGNGIAKGLRFALQLSANRGRNNLSRTFLNVIGRIAQRHARLQIEEESHGCELIQVIHCLRTQRLLPGNQLAQRHQPLSVVGTNIEFRKIRGTGTRRVLDFENHLILIGGFLDEINEILRVRITKQSQNTCFGNAVSLCLIAPQIDVQVRRVTEIVGRDRLKTWVLH